MKYTLRHLLIAVTVLGVMAATLRIPSPRSVLVMLVCVLGILAWSAFGYFTSTGRLRKVFGTATLAGCAYLLVYVATDSVFEAWINAFAIAPYQWMKAGPASSVPSADLMVLSNSAEFQYFQQKLHLFFAFVSAFLGAWYASTS